MLKMTVDAEGFESLDESLKGFYEESEGGYKLKVEGLEDTGALKRAKDHEKEARRKAETELNDLRKKMEDLEHKGLKDSGDYEALEQSFNKKLEKAQQEIKSQYEPYEIQNKALQDQLKRIMVTDKARSIAGQLAVDSDAAEVLLDHIQKRLGTTQLESGEFKSVILQDGKPSALTEKDLIEEFKADKRFARLLKGPQSSGSGANGGGSGFTGGSATKPTNISERIAQRKAARANS